MVRLGISVFRLLMFCMFILFSVLEVKVVIVIGIFCRVFLCLWVVIVMLFRLVGVIDLFVVGVVCGVFWVSIGLEVSSVLIIRFR